MKRGRDYLILLVISVFLMLGAIIFNRYYVFSLPEISKKASRNCEKKITLSKQILNEIFDKKDADDGTKLTGYFERDKLGLYLWHHDSLVFWNNSRIPVKEGPEKFTKQQGFIRLAHGYYLYAKQVKKHETAIVLSLVKPLYELQNNYLKNDFSKWTGIPNGIKIDTSAASLNAVAVQGENLFSLKGSDEAYYYLPADNIAFVGFLLGFFGVLVALLLYVKEHNKPRQAFLLVLLIPLLRVLMIWLKWPAFFYRTTLYDLQLFGNAQSFFNGYLGDILLNAVTLIFLTLAIQFQSRFFARQNAQLLSRIITILVIVFALNQFNQTAISLITNSTLSFDFLSIFNIRVPAFIGLIALSMYALALFILVNKSISFFKTSRGGDIFKFVLLYAAICVVQRIYSQREGLFENYWLVVYALILFVLVKLYAFKISLALGVQIILMSLVTSRIFNVYIAENQEKDLEILSLKLSEKQDEILESEFAGIPAKMADDESLNVVLNFLEDVPTGKKEAELLIKQKYFSGYFDRYSIDFSLFDKECHPLLDVKQAVLLNEGYFTDQIREYADSTFVEGLFFVKNSKKNAQYIGKIQLKDKNLYVLMEPKQFEELGSFPDLLLDQSQQKPEKLKNFSHAVYRSQQISSRFGDFNYPFFLLDSLALARSNPAFLHHYYQPDEDTDVVISQTAKSWNYLFTFNSYLLLFFSLMTYASYLVYSGLFTTRFSSPTLTRRIQTIIILLLLLAMSAVGITSGNLVSKQFERDNKRQLEEKTQIILNELSGQFKSSELFDPSQKEFINLKLREYARLFNTPISLFQKNGQLFNTSEAKLYDLGLASAYMNPSAYWKLKQNQSSSESANEKAGTLKYLSLYTPVFDEKKQQVGFINLPYFAKQSDLVNELSGIISALINVYVILFVISILAGLILSGFITQPLRLIKQQLGNVTFGKQNEKIVWQSNDEIGKLVSEYNQMLVKLEDSANLLAQSERESAWREMAKQVAHEIKNPLTPMKLNLQYLQHLMKNNPDDFREKFEKTSAGIIEQIDSLANIANEFSHFAKLPGTQLQSVNLSEIIASSVLIFENQKNIPIRNLISETELWVKGDRDQCLRVFNNVLKNALQALDERENPFVEISCERKTNAVVISIRDNGCGISDELKSKIFTPNFTTKTTGSGLGLAMVKNILLGFEGTIWFESENETGTVFHLQFVLSHETK